MSNKAAKKARRLQHEATSAEVHASLLRVIVSLRTMLAKDLKQARQRFPNHALPCNTCAFRTTTDSWEGTDTTVLLLLGALLTGSPFYCHVNPQTGEAFPTINGEYGVKEAMADGEPVNRCAGWGAISGHSREEIIGVIADALAEKPVPRPVDPGLQQKIMGLVEIIRLNRKGAE